MRLRGVNTPQPHKLLPTRAHKISRTLPFERKCAAYDRVNFSQGLLGGEFATDFIGDAADFRRNGAALGGKDEELGADEAGYAKGGEG